MQQSHLAISVLQWLTSPFNTVPARWEPKNITLYHNFAVEKHQKQAEQKSKHHMVYHAIQFNKTFLKFVTKGKFKDNSDNSKAMFTQQVLMLNIDSFAAIWYFCVCVQLFTIWFKCDQHQTPLWRDYGPEMTCMHRTSQTYHPVCCVYGKGCWILNFSHSFVCAMIQILSSIFTNLAGFPHFSGWNSCSIQYPMILVTKHLKC